MKKEGKNGGDISIIISEMGKKSKWFKRLKENNIRHSERTWMKLIDACERNTCDCALKTGWVMCSMMYFTNMFQKICYIKWLVS
jgi:hypothetical protein